jgi:type II secretory pathway component PulJ
MELLLGFSITAFIAVVTIDTLQQRRQNRKHLHLRTNERN